MKNEEKNTNFELNSSKTTDLLKILLIFDYDRTIYRSTDKTFDTVKQTEDGIKLADLKIILKIREENEDKFVRGYEHLILNCEEEEHQLQIQDYFKNKDTNNYSNFCDELFEKEIFNYNVAKDSQHLKIADLIAKVYKKIAEDDEKCECTYKNHWCYGPMHKQGFEAPLKAIETNFRNMALVKRYNDTIETNIKIKELMCQQKQKGQKIIIYTDNCKENAEEGLLALGMNPEDFRIIDMFETGGFNKKTKKGVENFLKIIERDFGITDPSKIILYDDNKRILENVSKFGIKVYFVENDRISKFEKVKW